MNLRDYRDNELKKLEKVSDLLIDRLGNSEPKAIDQYIKITELKIKLLGLDELKESSKLKAKLREYEQLDKAITKALTENDEPQKVVEEFLIYHVEFLENMTMIDSDFDELRIKELKETIANRYGIESWKGLGLTGKPRPDSEEH